MGLGSLSEAGGQKEVFLRVGVVSDREPLDGSTGDRGQGHTSVGVTGARMTGQGNS